MAPSSVMPGADTLLGMTVGAAAVWYLWNKLDDWTSGDGSSASSRRAGTQRERKFDEADLALFDGAGGKLCYVALPDGAVHDVTKSKSAFASHGGKLLSSVEADKLQEGGAAAIAKRFPRVGAIIIPRNFTKEELAQFDGRDGRPVYVCAKGVVYDVDPDFYGPEGPYGIMAGRDATRALALVSLDEADLDNNNIDDLSWMDKSTLEEWIAKFEMKYHRVGYLVDAGASSNGVAPHTGSNGSATAVVASGKTFLTKERQRIVLSEKITLSHDTRIFRFKLPEPDMRLGLPVGKHIKFWCPNPQPTVASQWNGREDPEAGKVEIERKYTPSSGDDALGRVDIVIKVYRGGEIDRFPDGGKMSQHLESLAIGDAMDIAGPFGRIEYLGKGRLRVGKKERHVQRIGMLAGGTGITPMLQLIRAVLEDGDDTTQLSLLFANQTEEDILVRDMLEAEQAKHPTRFKLWYTLDRPPAQGWKYSQGFVDADMIKAHMPPPAEDTVVLMCGPPPMVKFACKENLTKLGYDKDAQIEF